jgi:putative ATP-dependent endonuclease of the OLD family
MRLRSVTIKNFRALANVTVELDETTVLIGENNTGKTSFLEALKLCLAQGASRRGDLFDDYDHHLASDQSQVGDAGNTEITLRFAESTAGEWSNDVVQAISEAITLDGDLQQVVLRVMSAKDAQTGEMTAKWEFLDAHGSPFRPPSRPTGVVLRDLQQLKPFFYLSAVRDAAREFQPRSAFWGPFLRNPTIPDDVRKDLEADLDALNAKVIAADDKLKDVKQRLEKTGGIVSIRTTDAVAIEAVPGKARDLLSRAQVSVSGRTGARLPMTRHGAGTQSLSVLFLFESFLNSMLERIYGAGSVPIVAVEEPEAHLHPAASRALWKAISDMPGQKLVATHSGDLLARVPLENVRRFCQDGAGIAVRQLQAGTLDQDDARKMALHVKATRGELLFARSWLLVEGATEVWVFEGIADLLGIDLEREGVRIVQYAQVMPDPFIRLADDLGIGWFCVADGDREGQKYRKAAGALLNGRAEADHVAMLPEANMEIHLCNAGFGAVYERAIPTQNREAITASPGDSGYWAQVVAATGRGKESRAINVVAEMSQRGSGSVPPFLKGVLDAVVQIARGPTNGP